jgi:hypothetical protein
MNEFNMNKFDTNKTVKEYLEDCENDYLTMNKKQFYNVCVKEFYNTIKKIQLYQRMYFFHGEDSYEDVFREGKVYDLIELAKAIKFTIYCLQNDDAVDNVNNVNNDAVNNVNNVNNDAVDDAVDNDIDNDNDLL